MTRARIWQDAYSATRCARALKPSCFRRAEPGRDITVDELFDAEMNPIESAPHPRQEFYIRIDEAKENDIIRAI